MSYKRNLTRNGNYVKNEHEINYFGSYTTQLSYYGHNGRDVSSQTTKLCYWYGTPCRQERDQPNEHRWTK